MLSHLEWATRAKHDLGKYIAFQSRWLPPDASAEEWLGALESDLLHTRKGPNGSEGAVELWRSLRGEQVGLESDPDFRKVELAMERIAEQLEGLRTGALTIPQMMSLAEETKTVASHLSKLHKRLRGG